MFDSAWKPVEVNKEIDVFVLPIGACTAGVRLGASSVISSLGRAENLCNGFDPGHFMIGGVPFDVAFSVTLHISSSVTLDTVKLTIL